MKSLLKRDERPLCPACGRADCLLIVIPVFIIGKGYEPTHPQNWRNN